MLSAEYHIKQAEIAARLALAESDPVRAANLHIVALEHYEKAERAKAQYSPPLVPEMPRK